MWQARVCACVWHFLTAFIMSLDSLWPFQALPQSPPRPPGSSGLRCFSPGRRCVCSSHRVKRQFRKVTDPRVYKVDAQAGQACIFSADEHPDNAHGIRKCLAPFGLSKTTPQLPPTQLEMDKARARMRSCCGKKCVHLAGELFSFKKAGYSSR